MNREAARLFERLGVQLDPARIARGLSIAEQQLVEIAKALSLEAQRDRDGRADGGALGRRGGSPLRASSEKLRADGAAVLFISHRLEEVFALCQRVTVLRDGRHVMSRELAGLTPDDLVRAMVGRELVAHVPEEQNIGETVLERRAPDPRGRLRRRLVRVRAGEIVALAGLVGAGRSEVARAIFGIDRIDAGAVTLNGQALRRGSPSAAMAAGIGLVPEDRRQQGLVMEMSIARNITLASLPRLRRAGLIRGRPSAPSRGIGRRVCRSSTAASRDPMTSLSGGNQQKVVLAKWLSRQPRLLIVDEPTRGIDVGTKAEVHRLLEELAGTGVAVLVISSELPEVLRLANRVLVMREGRIVAEFAHADASEETIVAAATGQLEAAIAP